MAKKYLLQYAYVYVLFSTVLALILLYGGHCFLVQLPSKVMLRFPASHNNAPQHMTMFPGSAITA